MQRQLSLSFNGIDSDTPENCHLCAKYTRTFAYYTVKDRLPVILTKVVDYLVRDKDEIIKHYGESCAEDIKSVIGQISKLKNEVQTNKPLQFLSSSSKDIDKWNKYMSSQDEIPCWFLSPWLYVENYMYRRLHEIFENSETLQNYDAFQGQKMESFYNAAVTMKSISDKILSILNDINKTHNEKQLILIEMLKLSLWGNRCDLSLSCGDTSVTSKNEDVLVSVRNLDKFILADDSLKILQLVEKCSNKIIDIVQDNSAYELFTDLCLADVLCTLFGVSKIRFHVKQIPWYVSDVTEKDLFWLIDKISAVGMPELSQRWKDYLTNQIWSVHSEEYWTLPFDYSEMSQRDPTLYKSLSESNLVIFKGDLNYRKLLGDIKWNTTTCFKDCLRDFSPTNIVSLRTVKADLICGLEEGQSEDLYKISQDWMTTGEYGTIQFHNVEKNE